MESRSYMFSTAKKRSTLLESKGIEYELCDVGFQEMIQTHPVCVSQERNAQMNTLTIPLA